MRFKSAAAVQLFERTFDNAAATWRGKTRGRHALTRKFPDVAVIDSTILQVADELRPIFKGARAAAASLKVLLTISVFGLVPLHAKLAPGSHHDMKLFPDLDGFRSGTLLLFDKGFVAYERLAAIAGASLHFLCPMRLNGNATIVAARRGPKHVRALLRRSSAGIRLRDVLPEGKRIGKIWDLDVILTSGNVKGRQPIQTRCRLVIVPGPEQKQRPYLTTLAPSEWKPRALAETYRLRWQIELVFKELKQDLNLEALNSKDQYAVQIFAWASLIALALSRTVATWFCPLLKLVGLASQFRPALVSRALRGNVRILARAILASTGKAFEYLEILAEELLLEIRSRDRQREDSFKRLSPLLRTA
ncbi:MAG TPA: IS4 family transposase [Polyangiaceae bacterium]|nr:IS4 family transposase [Polyangiaceae bacterium]